MADMFWLRLTTVVEYRTPSAGLAGALFALGLALAGCGSRDGGGMMQPPTPDAPTGDGIMPELPPGSVDPDPIISFGQVAKAVGIDRSNEPASAGPFSASGTLAYGS